MNKSALLSVAVASCLVLSPCGIVHVGAQTIGQDTAQNRSQSLQAAYSVENDAICARNGERYHNRPLYCNHMPAVVLAGDRPHLRFIRDPYVYGSLMVALVRDGKGVWLHECVERISRYRPGRMEWELKDPSLPSLTATLDAVPMADAAGMSVHLRIAGTRPGDSLVWAFGGAAKRTSPNLPNISWELDPLGSPALSRRGFVPDDCTGNRVRLDGDVFLVNPPAYDAATKIPVHTVAGRCSAATTLSATDAPLWKDPVQFARGRAGKMPIVCGTTALKEDRDEIFWAVEGFVGDAAEDRRHLSSPQDEFRDGMRHMEEIGRQVVVDTPDSRFNAGVAAACHAMNGTFYPPVYVHGGMLWNVPFPGWRTVYGPTAFGWHENVKAEAKYYIASQETDASRTAPRADPNLGFSGQAPDSRFYGRGRIKQDNGFYNFQTLFFDMLVHAWRWTGDEELEKLLRPALEMHLQWAQDCFDPDGDGLYESYINVWPTDSVWYNGGGSAEETAYAYRGHLAAMDLARRAGDEKSEALHRERAAKIRTALMAGLWIPEKGYVGLYREQAGHKRLHEDSWLYSILCPIDAGMLAPEQAVQALYYTEWGLQRVRPAFGGERCWTSNWVPSVWSVRELYAGDNYHLALAYFQTGLPEAGWELLKGNFLESMYYSPVPGDCGAPNGGADFTDVCSMFCRTVVEGLFGYRPDYPNGVVRCAPRFPREWDHASIRTPDFSLEFTRTGASDNYAMELRRPARVAFDVLVGARGITRVELNGEPVSPSITSGFGSSSGSIEAPAGRAARLVIACDARLPARAVAETTGIVGERISLRSPVGRIMEYRDPQGVLTEARIEDGAVTGRLAANGGHHMVLGLATVGALKQWEPFRLVAADPQGDARREAQTVREVPKDSRWECVDMKAMTNGDVRTIYRQQYLSPRPKTCSVQIGADGYSPWTFYYWGIKPPAIDLAGADKRLDSNGRLVTPQGIPFAKPGEERNIAFTSLWNNWPRSVTVPVGKGGEAAWFLVCGSTNPMQTRIANGVLRLKYSDGITDTLELIPPLNYWTLCPLRGADYSYERDGFALPKTPPQTVQLGANCRAVLLNRRLRPGVALESVTLETLSQEVVIGLMGVTIMNPSR